MPVHNQKGPETYQTPRLRKYLHENRDIHDWVFIVFLIFRSIFVVYNRIISLGWKNDYRLVVKYEVVRQNQKLNMYFKRQRLINGGPEYKFSKSVHSFKKLKGISGNQLQTLNTLK